MSMLFNFRPLVVNPGLASSIGLNEAIVLQQIKYWTIETDAGVEHKGLRWVYNTHEQWAEQFPFWSVDTVKRTLSSLVKQGLVFVEKLNKAKHDQTNYYAINHRSNALIDQGNLPPIDEGKTPPIDQGNLPSSSGAKRPDVTETTTEITTETTQQAFGLFWESSLKNGSKKKAHELFTNYCKRTKTDPMAFALVLVNDTAARKKANQFGFDKLHVTTYLNQERWNDTVQAAAPGKPTLNQDFAAKTYEGTANDDFADFLKD
jgi:hypothetical protein